MELASVLEPSGVRQQTISRRRMMGVGVTCAAGAYAARFSPRAYGFSQWGEAAKVYDVTRYGAKGDGTTLDTQSIQRVIDEAAAYRGKAQVLLPGKHRFLIGTLELKGGIDFHLADDAQLIISTRREDYRGGLAGSNDADSMGAAAGGVLVANGARGLTISGTGTIQGRAREFMQRYDEAGQWWIPKDFRPKMFVLTECRDLEVRDITFAEAPNWGLHMLGCEGVLVDNVKVRNLLTVPNCDGIDPDHCRNVEIRNCDLVCGDDGVVIKCSRQTKDYGPCNNIRVHDCTIETQDAGLKIGTEGWGDVHDVRFEHCTIKRASRGLCIQVRDAGNVSDIEFRDITFHAQYFSDPWWGRGEAISFTALPRNAQTTVGTLKNVRVVNVSGTAENSVRVRGTEASPVEDVTFDKVSVSVGRTTQWPGQLFDNRPTTAMTAIEPHDTPGFSIEHARNVTLKDCSVTWTGNPPESFSYAVEARDAAGLKVEGLKGAAAHASLGKSVSIS
jgi:hypothetical protein